VIKVTRLALLLVVDHGVNAPIFRQFLLSLYGSNALRHVLGSPLIIGHDRLVRDLILDRAVVRAGMGHRRQPRVDIWRRMLGRPAADFRRRSYIAQKREHIFKRREALQEGGHGIESGPALYRQFVWSALLPSTGFGAPRFWSRFQFDIIPQLGVVIFILYRIILLVY